MNLRSGLGLAAVSSLALLMILMIASCGPSTYGRATGTPGTGAAPGTLPETGNQVTGTVTTTGAITATQGTTVTAAVTGTASVTGTTSATTAGAATGTSGTTRDRVEVVLKDYRIEMATTLPSGLTVFRVTNAGMVQHSFALVGPGFEESLPTYLESGQTEEFTVTLTAGTYTVYCPVDGHRDIGMEHVLTVTQGGP
jgi:uncharacterized cupredoxin-like copper-binding protein